MTANDYLLSAQAHEKISERLAQATEPKVSAHETAGNRRRHALARRLRRVADALDN